MAILDDQIAAQLLNRLEGHSNKEKWENLGKEYPWYPLPWLMLAETDAQKQKAALWFNNEHRIHWLLNRADGGTRPATAGTPAIVEKPAAELSENKAIVESQQSAEVPESEEIATKNLSSDELEIKFAVDPKEDTLSVFLDEEEIKEELESTAAEAVSTETADTELAEEVRTELVGDEKAADTAGSGIIEEKPATEEKLVFEPLFTTDYFASQGIKVDPNAIPITKLDRQVKTFTQWLKSMKRITPETSSAADPAVDAQATASVQEKDIVTEAMVAVLEKQGKYQKAIEILGKLILLHPEKSAFFAAQIENLKAKQ